MNGWVFTGVALWLLLNFIGAVAAIAGIGCDDNAAAKGLFVFVLLAAIASWAMFISFCLHTGGAL